LHEKQEISTDNWLPKRPVTIGITAGASCPNNLIEDAILRLYELHGIGREQLLA
jgi:4-hydroxy-3-methylbut-2-enyl diphosphate reductase